MGLTGPFRGQTLRLLQQGSCVDYIGNSRADIESATWRCR